ncbi:MAG: RDD family protein [Bacillota bacterium]
MERAGIGNRLLAALIDGLIAGLPSAIPIIGPIFGTLYILTKDAVVYELTQRPDFRNRSIGKKMLGLEVAVSRLKPYVTWEVSIRRNLPLAIGNIIMIIPLLGWVVGPVVGLVAAIVEIVMVLASEDGRRIGDRLADTTVINSPLDVSGE